MKNPILFIKLIRESFIGSEVVYTNGSCYKFYEILKYVFKDAKPYIADEGHIVAKIKNKFYDITGEVNGDFIPFDETFIKDMRTDIIFDDIKNNKFYGNIDMIQCPNCDEVFKI